MAGVHTGLPDTDRGTFEYRPALLWDLSRSINEELRKSNRRVDAASGRQNGGVAADDPEVSDDRSRIATPV